MSEITERVGKAVMALLAEVNPDGVWGNYDQVGRAVIEALRQPTQAMISAAYKAEADAGGNTFPDLHWQAMIDAALKEP